MGDRTTVTLTVLTSQAEAAAALFSFEPDNTGVDSNDNTEFVFQEVNYGNLGFLQKLADAGIAYDSYWNAGSGFGEGAEHGRFNERGEFVGKEIYVSAINPDLDTIMKYIDDPGALRRYILAHKESVDVLPLDTRQVEFGKLHRMAQLLKVDAIPPPRANIN